MIWNIQKGDKPIPHAAIERAIAPEMKRRGYTATTREKTLLTLMLDPTNAEAQAALVALAQFEADLANVKLVNAFNHELVAYRAAETRLARYPLAKGQEGITEEENAEGEMVQTIHVSQEPFDDSVVQGQTVVQPYVAPLVGGTVEAPVYDNEGNQTGTETQPDDIQKLIDQDEAERAAAQAVVDGAKQEVKDFV